ncbi:hypothetical protein CC78DRAFT_622088 [Lojkania enalia]|uniref:BTB domain-containing protein n=1 Tax=Lojkania enalia TaxID=147567 RepID=A0A9P4JX39_9PLEO|nr:hypothetical protein CC78DRAFT_622088 [Didymosphaeria enalia]
MSSTPISWAVSSFSSPGLYVKDQKDLRLQLDKENAQFGLIYKTEFGHDVLVQYPDDNPVYMCAAQAVSAVHCLQNIGCTKVALVFPQSQCEVYFTAHDAASGFLAMLMQLAGKSFTTHEISLKHVSHFRAPNYDVVKAGFGGRGNAAPITASDPLAAIFQRLWNTGEYSDFTVVAGIKEFWVHRSVLCTRSQFFEAACRPGFMEAEIRRIQLEEDAFTVETMLCEIYGVETEITGSVFTCFALKKEMEKEIIIDALLNLVVAADKYGLEAIKSRAINAIKCRIQFIREHWTITALASDIFAQCPEIDDGLRSFIIHSIESRLPNILADGEARKHLEDDPVVLMTLLDRYAAALNEGRVVGSFDLSSTLSSSPGRARKSARIALRTNRNTP